MKDQLPDNDPAILESEALERLLRSADIALLSLDARLRIVRYTSRAAGLLDLAPDATGQPLGAAMRSDSFASLPSDAASALQSGRPVDREIRSSSGRWLLVRVMPCHEGSDCDEAGPVGVLAIAIIDITRQRERESPLRAAKEFADHTEKRLQQMIAIDGIGVVVFAPSGTVIDANDAFLQMSGYDRDDVGAHRLKWQLLTAPAHREAAAQALETLRCTGRIGPREKAYLRKDGSSAWVLFVGADLGDGQLVEYCIDINDRKRTEAQLQESRERLEDELNAMRQLHDLVACLLACKDSGTALTEVLDASMQIVATELGAAHILDEESEALVLMAHRGFSRSVPEWLWNVPLNAPLACAQAVREKRRIVVSRLAAAAAGGSRFALGTDSGSGVIQSTPLIGRSGETVGVLSTCSSDPEGPTDRELRFLDLYARQAADFIEHVRYRDAANLASRRKDEFLATLAHELRNPLAPISMGLELLRARVNDPSAIEEARRTMRRQLDQLIALVDDLLDVSRISRGMLALKLRDIDIRDVIISAVEEVRPAIDKAGHKLTVDLPDGPIQIAADPHRLAQVMSNLLSNAAKFTPGGGSIDIAARREGNLVLLTVADNGIGIAPGMTQRIFEMFGQIDRTRAQSGAGLGIGLTLVKSLTELHGGTVDVDSAGEGRGAKFTVRLPVPVQAELIDRDCFPEDSGDTRQLRVLVVDDSKPAADLLAMVLETLGHEVSAAYDGAQAAQMAEAFRPDAVIMDIGMPTLDGYAAARHMRSQPWGERLTMIALTGRSRETDRKRSREAGFDHHLVKPVKAHQLRKVLARARRDPERGL